VSSPFISAAYALALTLLRPCLASRCIPCLSWVPCQTFLVIMSSEIQRKAPVPIETTVEKAESSNSGDVEYDEKATKALLRKIDIHIVPVLVILYLLSFLDRTNIGNARLAGLEKDLHMKGLDYNVRSAS
jgi:hypothetical protein